MRALRLLVAAAACVLIAACAGYTQYQEGRRLTMQGNLDAGLVKLAEAMQAAPDNANYRQEYERQLRVAVSRHISDGDLARSSGDLARATDAYRRALTLEPGNQRALASLAAIDVWRGDADQIQQARVDIEQGNLGEAETRLKAVLARDSRQREARDLLNVISDRRAELQERAPSPQLKAPFTKPITLEFRDASLKSVFEVISRSSGINFVFDRDVRGDAKINIFVRDTSLDDVIKLILVTNQLDRKLLNENSVLIFPNTPAKQKEYKELVVRSFYLSNADVKQALNLVKGMVKTQDVFVDEKLNMMIVKDTPEAVRVVSQLVRAIDLAEPEVMLEVEVLELSSTTLQTLGLRYPEQVNFGKPPIPSSGSTPGVATADVFVIGTDTLKAFVLNPPIILDIKAADSNVKVLANPRIRVKNREKAKVHIGDRVPVVTTTSTANVGVSSSVSYLDVGLKLDVEPNVYLRDEVAIKVGLEVSNIRRVVPLQDGGIAYELGTRNTSTVLQLKDGETQVLAGLISDEDRNTATKIPGLGDFPVLGRLFRSDSDERKKTEIVLLITPRVVRTLDFPQFATANLAVGTDAAIGQSSLRISRTAPGTLAIAPSGAGGAATARPLTQPAQPIAVPLPPEGTEAAGGVPPALPAEPGESTAAAGTGAAQMLMAGPLAARSATDILVSLTIASGGPVNRATAEVVYDPLQLDVVGADASTPGRLPVRIEGSAVVRFRVRSAAGLVQVRVENIVGVDAAGAAVAVMPPQPLDITITP